MVTDFRGLLRLLYDGGVEFAVIGGVALTLHGSARGTDDLDVCYERSGTNCARLAAALAPLHPRLRGAPAELPFKLDAGTILRGLNFTLVCDAGAIDLLGEVPGLGSYAQVLPLCDHVDAHGQKLPVLGLDGLERAKLAAGRYQDLADVAEIREIRARREELAGPRP